MKKTSILPSFVWTQRKTRVPCVAFCFGFFSSFFCFVFCFSFRCFALQAELFSEFVPTPISFERRMFLCFYKMKQNFVQPEVFFQDFCCSPREKEKASFFRFIRRCRSLFSSRSATGSCSHFSEDPKFSGWVFRDTNFSPDFSESAQDALRFYNLILGLQMKILMLW